MNFEIFLQAETWIALGTLTALEIILGIDNILFISIISNKLPAEKRPKARTLGLGLALLFRILLLLGISWLVKFTKPLFSVLGQDFSGRDLILLAGGIFLLVKTISEIHQKVEGKSEAHVVANLSKAPSMVRVIWMILLIDLVFSFDSILTAVGMVSEVGLMIIAIIIAMAVMVIFVNKISDIIQKHPSLQMLALSFLILIAFVLILDGLHKHIERGYVYFALFFSLLVELLNLRSKNRSAAS